MSVELILTMLLVIVACNIPTNILWLNHISNCIQKNFQKLDKVEDKIITMQKLFTLKQNSLYEMEWKINSIHNKISILEDKEKK